MAEQQYRMLDADDLTDADEKILDELRDGARTKGAIVDATGLHRNTVGGRLPVLEAGDAIRCIHDSTALYELVDDPRGTNDTATPDESEVKRLREQLDDAHKRIQELEADDGSSAADECHEAVLNARGDLEQASAELDSPNCDGEIVARNVDSALKTLNEVDV
ncbi:hypothetical protein [Halalkalicoccus sp. NIPERK01]|uniref:hypothetical protein n=1 Tax=Halalkalicoccus sp. NIPERK01 TaxID=3053469 RepID=UPI00256EEB36|nr:hypothetical protein [Halalkalicoccus sp. NIPERK01]MDL5361329.1 hypothetical protein [Halalkalicoccus sp. NIPERK01]